MFATNLNSLLSDGISPDNIQKLSRLLNDWFAVEPTVSVYVLRSIFADLCQRWDTEQGIPTPEFEAVQQSVLIPVRRIATMLSTNRQDEVNAELDQLIKNLAWLSKTF